MKKKITKKLLTLGVFVVIGLLMLAIYVWQQEHRPHIFEMYIFNLKSGNSILVRTPNDKRILINGGANSEIIRELTKILPFYSRRIDEIIATDTNGKDVTGLIDVLSRYSVSQVVVPSLTLEKIGLASTTDQIYSTFIDTVKQKNISIREVTAGDHISLDDSVNAEVLFPFATTTFEYSKASAPEIILRIVNGANSFLLLGNATTKMQKSIASSTSSTDVLVIPHNASSDSLATLLIDVIQPKYLIYLKSITQSSKSAKSSKPDPLYLILDDKRFNVKGGTVRIVFDGKKLDITQIQ